MWKPMKGGRVLVCLTAAGVVGALAPAAANASTLQSLLSSTVTGVVSTVGAATSALTPLTLANGTSCLVSPSSMPFTPWQDANNYRIAPGGDFSVGSTNWSLSGGASLAANTDPYTLAGTSGNGELVLPAGATATSPFSCVDTSQPTVRLMDQGSPNAELIVNAVFQEAPGLTLTLPIGTLDPSGTWRPSPILYNDQGVAGLLSGGAEPMALSLTATGGTVVVDDAFVDPYMRS